MIPSFYYLFGARLEQLCGSALPPNAIYLHSSNANANALFPLAFVKHDSRVRVYICVCVMITCCFICISISFESVVISNWHNAVHFNAIFASQVICHVYSLYLLLYADRPLERYLCCALLLLVTN